MAEVEAEKRKILVAIDEGEESMYALSWCLNNVISRHFKDTLILLHAQPAPAVYGAVDGTGYLFSSEIMAAMERHKKEAAYLLMERAERLCAEIGNVVQVERRVESGDARDAICQMAEKLDVDLVVMGSHGYGMIKRAFLGSVSSHCAQNVKCPVMIVKMPKPAAKIS